MQMHDLCLSASEMGARSVNRWSSSFQIDYIPEEDEGAVGITSGIFSSRFNPHINSFGRELHLSPL
jgi:hypothetical protein